MTTQEAEIVDEPMPSNAIALRPSMSVGQAMGVNEIVAQVKLIQDVMHKVMTDGEHYGTIPGCGNKKTLLQPGAQKLTMTFRLAPEYQIQETNLERGHKEYRVICTLKSMGNGSFVGQGVGCCSSMEGKYRWRGGSRKCPECGKETIIKGKAEYGGGWLCFQKKGGCGFKWPDGAQEIEGQDIGKVENDNPADTFNTVLKMAKKRAFVDATITATAASDIFTQDIGDDEAEQAQEAPAPASKSPQTRQNAPKAQSPPPDAQSAPEVKSAPFPTAKTRAWMIEKLQSNPGSPSRDMVTDFFVKAGVILESEALEDMPLRWCANSESQIRLLAGAITAFEAGERAGMPYKPHDEPEPAPKAKPAPKKAIDVDVPSVTGKIQMVSLKEGTGARGAWSRFGIKVNDEWYSTFNKHLGMFAQRNKGVEVQIQYAEGKMGKDCVDIIFQGASVLDAAEETV